MIFSGVNSSGLLITDGGLIIIAVIGALQAVTLAVIGRLNKKTGKVEKDTAVTRDNVVNHHSTNMRVEGDTRHDETMRWFSTLSGKLDRQGRQLNAVTLRMDEAEAYIENDKEIHNDVTR